MTYIIPWLLEQSPLNTPASPVWIELVIDNARMTRDSIIWVIKAYYWYKSAALLYERDNAESDLLAVSFAFSTLCLFQKFGSSLAVIDPILRNLILDYLSQAGTWEQIEIIVNFTITEAQLVLLEKKYPWRITGNHRIIAHSPSKSKFYNNNIYIIKEELSPGSHF